MTTFNLNPFACNECKRRRIKCARQLPVCALCLRAKRHCLYESPQRSPLTRRHLTEVEEEVKLVKALFNKYLPQLDIEDLVLALKKGSSLDDMPEIKGALAKAPVTPGTDENTENGTANGFRDKRFEHVTEGRTLWNKSRSAMNIQTLLSHSERTPESADIYQVPQLLPPLVHTFSEPGRSTAETPLNPSRRICDWDERFGPNRTNSDADGMATTELNCYLGLTSLAAVINLVGGGYFFERHNDPLPPPAQKPPLRGTLEMYVSHYFDKYHILYPILYKPLFMAQLNEIVTPPPGWQALFYIVAALGLFMASAHANDDDDLYLFDKAKKLLLIEHLETGNLTLVQTFTLMLNYLQKRDRPNSGYNYLGIAVRMAMGLGLHKDFHDLDELLLNIEIKRRMWWCLYIFDSGQTITYGRPLGIPCAGVDTELPMNIADLNLTAVTKTMPPMDTCPTIYTSLRLQALFHVFTNGLYERVITEPFPSAAQLLEWDLQFIQRWKSLLPDYFNENASVPPKFKLAHAILHWRCRHLRIIMYRTFMLKRLFQNCREADEYERKALEVCLEECSATIHSMSSFWDNEFEFLATRMDAWYTLFFLIPAVLMPLVCLRNDPFSLEAARWRHDVHASERIVHKLLHICPPATRISELIHNMGDGLIEQQKNSPTYHAADESPTSQLLQLHSMLWPSSFDIEQQF